MLPPHPSFNRLLLSTAEYIPRTTLKGISTRRQRTTRQTAPPNLNKLQFNNIYIYIARHLTAIDSFSMENPFLLASSTPFKDMYDEFEEDVQSVLLAK